MDNKVVASVRGFVDAAHGNSAMSSIQPGYYQMRTEISAADAVRWLTDPNNRVGKLVIPEGRQLDDVQDVKTNAVTEGILMLISRASCVQLDGNRRCVPVTELPTSPAPMPPRRSTCRRGPSRRCRRWAMIPEGWRA